MTGEAREDEAWSCCKATADGWIAQEEKIP